eukprot:COSAG06_NODE_22555_length_719_cov_2.727419_1_plen_62_part_00
MLYVDICYVMLYYYVMLMHIMLYGLRNGNRERIKSGEMNILLTLRDEVPSETGTVVATVCV